MSSDAAASISQRRPAALGFLLAALLTASQIAHSAGERPTPLRQSSLTPGAQPAEPLTLRDVSRNSRWLGVGVSDVRWSPDAKAAFFRWHESPRSEDDPDADPWYRVDRAGRGVQRVAESDVPRIPAQELSWSQDGHAAVWVSDGRVYSWLANRSVNDGIALLYAGAEPARSAVIRRDSAAAHVEIGEALYELDIAQGGFRQIARAHHIPSDKRSAAARRLADEQLELFDVLRQRENWKQEGLARERARATAPQAIPLEEGVRLENIQLSPDGSYLTFRVVRPADRKKTQYMDYVTASGQAEAKDARPKVGDPRDAHRFGIVRIDPSIEADAVPITWVELPEVGERGVVTHGPYWSVEGDRALIQMLSQDHKDIWFVELDLSNGSTTVRAHHRDEAWIGGPSPVGGSLQPALLEWLPGGRFVFAAELDGWSHLHLVERDGDIRALTSGDWEVRDARLNRDRTQWLIGGGREDPTEDHLYLLPAAGGELVRITDRSGRNNGILSPDGGRLALIHSEQLQLPDLYLRDTGPTEVETRITESGADPMVRHALVRPEMVSFPHTDGRPLWAALFKPETPHPLRPAVLHIHGGGYRQFAHQGWSVYGWHHHIGFINWLVQQGYTVLDFDYRGSAGFGRDYRTDIYRSMGQVDVDGAVTAVSYLVREHGVDPARVGIYGLSYGGFLPLMALFRYPGVFAAGVANVAVTDWAHYNDMWTSRILNLPQDDPDAYRASSPIFHAEGLQDPLFIVHGVVDDNVHFQDAVRLVQRLIELEKDFELMYYPVEPHIIGTEPSRYDFHRRLVRFFAQNLLRQEPAKTMRE